VPEKDIKKKDHANSGRQMKTAPPILPAQSSENEKKTNISVLQRVISQWSHPLTQRSSELFQVQTGEGLSQLLY
jgi:hypothetical protein